MKTTFEYDHEKAVALCCEYSDAPEILQALIARLKITVGPSTVIPSPWSPDHKALHMMVTVEGLTFPYHGSHNDAQTMGTDLRSMGWNHEEKKRIEAIRTKRKDFRDGLLYSLLCCIKSDLYTLHEDPEDLGMNSDSIKDMANWNECKEHARKLQTALRLTPEERDSLPS